MKKTLLLLSILLLIISCPKKETSTIKLSPGTWNETNKYRILIDTTVSGSYQLIYKTTDQTIELQSITQVTQTNVTSYDSTALVLRQDNLRPISSFKTIITGGATITSDIKYTDNKASIKAKLPQGEKSIDIPINVNTYDNDQITTILRAIELKVNEEKEINIAIGLSGTTVPIKIKLLGEEKIKVPAGEFDCNKYILNVVGRTIDAWYEKTDAKRMIRYFDVQSNMAMELTP